MDVSGKMDNYQYLGIVIGEKNNIDALYRKMGSPKTHMSGLSKDVKKHIISKLLFDQNHRIAFCVKLDRKLVIQEVQKRRITKYRRMPKGKLFAMFERTLFKYLKHEIEKYTLKHHHTVNEIPVECDSDSIVFAKVWGAKSIKPDSTHFIADALAWCNTNHIKLDTAIELDYSKIIKKEMIHRLQK